MLMGTIGVGVMVGEGPGVLVVVGKCGVVTGVWETEPQAEADQSLGHLEGHEGDRGQDEQEDDEHQYCQGFASWVKLCDLVERFSVGATEYKDKESPQPPATP